MSTENGKVCCNCRHDIRTGNKNHCEVDGTALPTSSVWEDGADTGRGKRNGIRRKQMRKIKFYLETGYAGATHTETVEYPDNTEDSEIEEDLEAWKESCISYGWEEE